MREKRLTQIKKQLTNAFHPKKLIVTDESRYHQDHSSAGGKGHFTISITAKAFNNKTLLERHRLIYEALDDLMKTDIHALKIYAVDES
ncbi:MAG: BolA family protein [Coxiella-like endosymbiont]